MSGPYPCCCEPGGAIPTVPGTCLSVAELAACAEGTVPQFFQVAIPSGAWVPNLASFPCSDTFICPTQDTNPDKTSVLNATFVIEYDTAPLQTECTWQGEQVLCVIEQVGVPNEVLKYSLQVVINGNVAQVVQRVSSPLQLPLDNPRIGWENVALGLNKDCTTFFTAYSVAWDFSDLGHPIFCSRYEVEPLGTGFFCDGANPGSAVITPHPGPATLPINQPFCDPDIP